MKRLATIFALALVAGAITAQEIIPQEKLEKAVPRALARVAEMENLPITIEADGTKAFGMEIKDYAAVVIPDKGLAKEALAGAGKAPVPVGQLWLVKLSPSVNGAAVSVSKLRMVTITVKEEDHRLPVFLLGARKQGEGGLELTVYAKGKEPLLTLPLQKRDSAQNMPLEIGLRQGTTTLGLIDIYLLGEYQATLPVEAQE